MDGNAMDEQLENRLRFLRKASTEQMPHSERGLFDHLLGTRQLLEAVSKPPKTLLVISNTAIGEVLKPALVEWGARPALCDAGLFHSIYSTEYYEQAAVPLTSRNDVRQLIGDEAESLVWLFCMMRRETLLHGNLERQRDFAVQHRLTGEQIPLSDTQFGDLVMMTMANSLEAFPRCSWKGRRDCRRGLRRFRSIAIPAAQVAIDRVDIRWWEVWK
jgi:hypothetical protein